MDKPIAGCSTQSGGRVRWGSDGSAARIRSPGNTSPPSDTIAMTPDLKRGPCGPALQSILQSGLKAIDEDAGRAQAGKLEGCRGAKPEHCSQRKAFEIEADRRDVLAEISAADVEAGRPERIEQFARDEVHLAKIGRLRICGAPDIGAARTVQ